MKTGGFSAGVAVGLTISYVLNWSSSPIIDRAGCPPSPPTHAAHLEDTMKNDIRHNMTVEDLMYKFKSDKSRDDHGYTKVYELIFAPIRHSVVNVTEVGVSTGNSIQAWHRYFPNAEIHGFDVEQAPEVAANLDALRPRFRSHTVDVLAEGNDPVANLGFAPESMDVIIEDGPHTGTTQQDFLVRLFPLLRPGGIYVIEDIWFSTSYGFHVDPENKLSPDARTIMEENDCIWVDASLGHRAWGEWMRRSGRMIVKDHIDHNSYMVIVRKRDRPLRPLQINYGSGAMEAGDIVREDGSDILV